MRKQMIPLLLCLLTLAGCGGGDKIMNNTYTSISADEAKRLMETTQAYILLDVRTQSEYDKGHIEGALLIPNTEIQNRANQALPDKNAMILVYCRSGKRSAAAAHTLADLSYTNVFEFGGILDWPYALVT